MISKEDILKNFLKEDWEEVIKIYDSMNLAYTKDIPTFTKFFCKPNIWLYFTKNFNSKSFNVEASGAYDECDRRIISFNNIYDTPFPFRVIKIINKSKFNNLAHRDYLGALMSLGLERDKLGDLRVIDNYAIVPVYEDIYDYIVSQLDTVSNSPVIIEEILGVELPRSNFKEETIIIPSLRIDNFVAKLAKCSRGKAVELMQANKVLLDYCKVKEKSQDINEGQCITISGIGKFKIGNIIGNTKSGRYKINIKKYV